ncbi:MAG TPA: phage holin family protein [Blastocatellia bacterium]|nr:phage holin family protein [Blastocatellia bacterium]
MQTNRHAEMSGSTESIGDLLSQLAVNSGALVRDEIMLARAEIGERVKLFSSRLVTPCLGLFIGLLGVMTLTAAAIIGLAQYLGIGYSCLIIGGGLAVAGTVTAIAGIQRLRETSLKPVKTIETWEEDKQWLKQLT